MGTNYPTAFASWGQPPVSWETQALQNTPGRICSAPTPTPTTPRGRYQPSVPSQSRLQFLVQLLDRLDLLVESWGAVHPSGGSLRDEWQEICGNAWAETHYWVPHPLGTSPVPSPLGISLPPDTDPICVPAGYLGVGYRFG